MVTCKEKAANIRIFAIRDQKVVVDTDLAAVYGVTTKRLNEQLRRNRKRFPQDFAFQLTANEFEYLRSQTPTLNDTRGSWSQFAALKSARGQHRKYRPWVFTEHGALQAANILRSDRAIAMSTYVIRAFIEQREKLAASAAILRRLTEIDKTLLEHGHRTARHLPKTSAASCPPPEPPPPPDRILCRIVSCGCGRRR